MINITATGIIESIIIYGFVHTFWTITKWTLRHLGSETGQIIEAHVKENHNTKFKYCVEGACIKLQTELGSLHQVKQ